MIKYCIIDRLYPIISIGPFSHEDFKTHGNITSAANLKIENGRVICYGHSHSLKLGPHNDDEKILNMFLFGRDAK